LLRAGDDDQITLTRLGLSLDGDEVDELHRRLTDLLEEFARRSRTRPEAANSAVAADVESLVLLLSMHRLTDVDP
jgi:hypothetical protein